MPIQTGEKAPDFTLKSFTPSEDITEITLSSSKGKKNVLLLFFPQAFTGVCSEEMCTISDGLNDFQNDDLDVYGISVDGTFVQKAFAKQNNIKMPLLCDYNREVIRKYDIVQKEFAHGMKETSRRAVFLIDKEGVVRYSEVTENPGTQINFDKAKEAVKSL